MSAAGRACAFGLILGLALFAQKAHGAAASTPLKERRLDLTIPTLPTFTVLGVSPSNVSRPGSIRELALGLSNGISREGQLQTGLALEFSPAKLLAPFLERSFAGSTPYALLSGLQLSGGTNAEVEGAQTTFSLAYGARYTYTTYDPLTDTNGLLACLQSQIPPPSPIADPAADSPRRVTKATGLPLCRRIHRASHLAATAIELAGATVESAVDDAHLSALRWSRTALWVSASWGFNSYKPLRRDAPTTSPEEAFTRRMAAYRALVSSIASGAPLVGAEAGAPDEGERLASAWGFEPLVFARLDWSRAAASDAQQQRDFLVATRLSFLRDGSAAFVEFGVRLENISDVGGEGETQLPLGLGGELRLANGTWLGVFFGADARGKEGVFVLSNLKWAIGEERPFN